MDIDNSKLKSIVFENFDDRDVRGLKSVAILIIACKAMRKSFKISRISKNCSDQECISCIFKSIFESLNNKAKIDLSILKRRLKILSASKGIPNKSQLSDAMEILGFILNAFHCDSIVSCSDGTNEFISQKSCLLNCSSHNTFGLKIKEEYTCKCRTSFEIKWDNSNFFQYFNISNIISSANYSHSMNLLNVPKILLTEDSIPKNSHIKNQMTTILAEKLKHAQRNLCSNENCIEKSSSVKFILEKSLEMYIINILWESNEIGHLDCYLSTISITGSFLISDVYYTTLKQRFNIVGIMFLKDKDYEYAFRDENLWFFRGDEKGASWLEIVTKAISNKYHPVGLFYEKSTIEIELNIPIDKLVWLEKTACKLDYSSLNLPESLYQKIIDKFDPSSSKKNIIKKKQKADSDAWTVSKESAKKAKDSSNFDQNKIVTKDHTTNIPLSKWSCECGRENENEWTICQKCKKIKQGLSGWACSNCTFHNKNGIKTCGGCELFDPNRNKWQCNKCYKFYQIDIQQCLLCKTYNSSVSSEMKNKLEKAQTNDVVESGEADNFNCPQCKIIGNNIKNKCAHDESKKFSADEVWLCAFCYKLNKLSDGSCKKCQQRKKQNTDQKLNKEPAEENKQIEWICDSCHNSNDFLSDKCKICKIVPHVKSNISDLHKKPKEKLDPTECQPEVEKSKGSRMCIKCKKENDNMLETCSQCINDRYLANSSAYSMEATEIKNPRNENLWVCKKCSYSNSSIYACLKCHSTKEEKVNNLVESKEEEKDKSLSENKIWKCESCKNSTSVTKSICDFCDLPKWSSKESWVCSHCKKVNKFALGSCLYCNKKCLKVIKVSCEKCEILVYSPEVLCEKCKKQISSSELFWECQSCKKKNENNLLGCKYCFKEKTQNTQSLENKNSNNILENMDSKPKCSICKKEISLLFCKSCVRAVLYGEKCIYCKKHLIDVTTCYTCFNKSGLSQKSPYFFKPNS